MGSTRCSAQAWPGLQARPAASGQTSSSAACCILAPNTHNASCACHTADGKQCAAQRLVGPEEISRGVAALTGGAGSDSEAVNAIRALPTDQKLALIAAYQLIGASALIDAMRRRLYGLA